MKTKSNLCMINMHHYLSVFLLKWHLEFFGWIFEYSWVLNCHYSKHTIIGIFYAIGFYFSCLDFINIKNNNKRGKRSRRNKRRKIERKTDMISFTSRYLNAFSRIPLTFSSHFIIYSMSILLHSPFSCTWKHILLFLLKRNDSS